ncbi:membrane protein, yeeR [Escherichia coli]|uniref:Membrane protein, yeeR n=1 Tax=Escherichia coli TaxID=562 RepID=A0A376VEV9_ECOLX|nr:membrane protein, yeeR [Escherichia coli]
MLQIVGALILLIAGFAILRLLFRALISTASALAGLILLCLFGPALLAGYITERITRLFHIRWLAGVFLTIAGMIISFMWGLDGKHIALEAHTFDSVKFILTTALAAGLLALPVQIRTIQQNGLTPEDISKEINGYYCCFYTAFFLMACSAYAPLIALPVRYFTLTDVVGRVVVLAGCISDAAMGGQPDPGAEKTDQCHPPDTGRTTGAQQ